jgi:hypothetical protein
MIKKVFKWIGIIIVLMLIVRLMEIVGIIDEPEPVVNEQQEKTVTVQDDLSLEAHTLCKMLIENGLPTPATADFPFANRKIFKKPNQRYIVKDYVDFQNRYGATIRGYWHCDIQFKGGDKMNFNNWKLLHIENITQ